MENKITAVEMKTALIRSGYLLENKVANILRKKRLIYITTNDVFKDPETSKSREIDIQAYTMKELLYRPGCTINIHYIIEVINNTQPVSFIVTKDSSTYILPNIKYIADFPKSDKLHYDVITGNLALEYNSANSREASLQYCSYTTKKSGNNKNEWMAFHPEDLHETFKKLLYVTDINNDKHLGVAKERKNLYGCYIQPVLVLKDDLYKISVCKNNVKFIKTNLLHFIFNYIYNGKQSSIVIDVITEKYISKYINNMDKNIEYIKSHMDNLVIMTKK